MSLHPLFAEILAAFQGAPPKPIDMTGATDGYFEAWSGTQQVTPDFTQLKQGEN